MTVEPEPDLRIGRVLKAHGVKGSLRVELLTVFPDRFAPGSEVVVAGRPLRVAVPGAISSTGVICAPRRR